MRSSGTVSQLSRPDNMSCEKCECFRLLTVNWSSFLFVEQKKHVVLPTSRQSRHEIVWSRHSKKQKEQVCENFEISITVSRLHAKTAAFESFEFGACSMNSFYICTATRALTLAWSAPPPFFGVLSGSKIEFESSHVRYLRCNFIRASHFPLYIQPFSSRLTIINKFCICV